MKVPAQATEPAEVAELFTRQKCVILSVQREAGALADDMDAARAHPHRITKAQVRGWTVRLRALLGEEVAR